MLFEITSPEVVRVFAAFKIKAGRSSRKREGDRFLAAVCVSRRAVSEFKCEKILQVKYRFKKNQNEVMRIIKSMKCKEKIEEKNYYVA